MKLRRMPSHPAFRLEGRSRHFQSLWELELTPGEATSRHQHYESEEIIYVVHGEGRVRVAELDYRMVPGEVVLVPPRTEHVIANQGDLTLRAITVESRLVGHGGGTIEPASPEQLVRLDPAVEAQVRSEAEASIRNIEEVIGALPSLVDEAVAIKTLVELFDIGGQISERIEKTLGLDSSEGLTALGEVERKIMLAVVEVSSRYKRPGSGRWLWG